MEASKKILETLYDSIEDIVLITNSDYEIEHINRKGEEVFNKKGGSSVGKKCYQVICHSNGPDKNCPLLCLKKNIDTIDNQIIKSGDKYLRVKASIIKDEDGKEKFIDVLHDVTEFIKKEQTLQNDNEEYQSLNEEYLASIEELEEKNKLIQEAKERFEQLFSNMNTAFALHEIILDKKGKTCDYRFIECNKMFEQLTGLQSVDILGKTVLEVMPETEKYWIETYGEVALTGKPYHFTNYSKELDKYYETRTYCPKRGFFAVTFNDVTEKLKAEKNLDIKNKEFEVVNKELEDSLDRTQQLNTRLEETVEKLEAKDEIMQTIFNNAPSVMMLLDENTDIIQMNYTGLQTTGKDGKQVVGLRGGDVFNCIETIGHTKGCGNGKNCGGCKIRQTVENTLKTGKDNRKVDAELTIQTPSGENTTLFLLVSSTVVTDVGKKSVLVTIEDITDLKRKEQLLKENEEKFKSTFYTNPDVIGIIDSDGRIVELNPSFTKTFGYEIKESLGKTTTDLKFWIYEKEKEAMYSQLLSEGVVTNMEVHLRHKSGQQIIGLFSASQILLNNQPFILAIIRDISNVKLDRHYLRKAQEIGRIGTWQLDISNGKLAWTDENYKIFGVSPETELTLDVFISCLHPDDKDFVLAEWDAAVNGKPYAITHRIVVDGKTKWIYQKADIVYNQDGKGISAIGVTQDITQQKSQEENLKRLNDDINLIYEYDPAFIILKDTKNNIIRVSNKVAEMTGMPRERIEGSASKDIYPELADQYYQADLEVINSKKPKYGIVEELVDADGKRKWLHTNKIPILEKDKVKSIILFSTDITELKRSEMILQEKNEEYEALNEELNQTNKELYNTKEALKIKLDTILSPDGDIKDLKLTEFIELEQLQAIQDSFALASGVASVITTTQGIPITKPSNFSELCSLVRQTEQGTKNCYKSDKLLGELAHKHKKTIIQPCLSCGLYDAGTPIVIGGNVIAYWLIGQVRTSEIKEGQITKYAKQIGADVKQAKHAFNKIEVKDVTHFKNIAKHLEVLAKEISQLAYNNVRLAKKNEEVKKHEEFLKIEKENTVKKNILIANQNTELELHNQRLESLLRIAKFNTTSKQELLDYALNEAINLTESKIGYIYFYNEQTKQFTLNTWSKDVMKECRVMNPQTTYDLDSTGCWGEVVRQKKPIIINDYTAPNQHKKGTPHGHVALTKFMSVPVIINNKIVAVAGVANKKADYTQTDVKQLTLLMDNVWNICERLDLVESLKTKNVEIEISKQKIEGHTENLTEIIEINKVIGYKLSELYDLALEKSQKLTQSNIGFLGIVNSGETEVKIHAWSKSVMGKCMVKDISFDFNVAKAGIWGEAVRTKKPFVLNDYKNNHPLKKGTPEGHVAIKNFLAIPVIENKKVVAIIAVGNKNEDYDDIDVNELQILADNVWFKIKQQKYQEEIIHEKEKAEKADRLKSAFLANMSHEIRTPLNGLMGFSDVMASKKNLSESDRVRYADIIKQSGDQLLHIVNDVLDISAIESGTLEVNKKLFEINNVLFSIYKLFELKKQNTNSVIELNFKRALGNITLENDENRFIQILTNLLDNALKFTHEGSVEFGVMNVKKRSIEFFVKDTGIGIDNEQEQVIFDRFRQAEISSNRLYGGNGLGLSIVKELLSLMGGEIWVESEVNKGSCFYFSLPYNAPQNELSENNIQKINNSEDISLQDKLNILVVEDDFINQEYMREMLSDLDINLTIVANGNEGIQQAKLNNFDIILMDIRLPDINGFDATKEIRKFNYRVPIIAQTAYAMSSDEEEAYRSGCNGYLSKPIKQKLLFEKIKLFSKKSL